MRRRHSIIRVGTDDELYRTQIIQQTLRAGLHPNTERLISHSLITSRCWPPAHIFRHEKRDNDYLPTAHLTILQTRLRDERVSNLIQHGISDSSKLQDKSVAVSSTLHCRWSHSRHSARPMELPPSPTNDPQYIYWIESLAACNRWPACESNLRM
jgi:hypothetical protein